jgi:hypothetical protein
MRKIHTTPRSHPSGAAFECHADNVTYVALQHFKLGDKWLRPGDRVSIEPGRDAGVMLRAGQIQQVIQPSEK